MPNCDGHGCDPELDVLPCAEVDGYEGEPDDAGGVHAEADELGLVEGLGDLAGEDGVEGAHDHQQDRVREGDHVRRVHGRLRKKGKMSMLLKPNLVWVNFASCISAIHTTDNLLSLQLQQQWNNKTGNVIYPSNILALDLGNKRGHQDRP